MLRSALKANESQLKFQLEPQDNSRLATLCGQFNENLHLIERHLGIEISNRGHVFQIIGIPKSVQQAKEVIETLYQITEEQSQLGKSQIMLVIKTYSNQAHAKQIAETPEAIIKTKKTAVKARTNNQMHYIQAIKKQDINFGIGPAGTGKTFLAAACAVEAFEQQLVSRIVLVRPAVEAGEKLGFLPGDLSQKVDPYLRPLYDSLFEMLHPTQVEQLIERNIIEIAPLAYMRGRTLNDAFIILDEAQNTTREQMKMFLTRIGFNSKAVITGDITQTDLPPKIESGLRHAISLLQNIKGIQFTFFTSEDVVRHPLVQQIIQAYESTE